LSQRVERVAGEVRAILGEVLARDEIKDPRVRGAGLITVTFVRVSGDLRYAKALFTVHGLDAEALERVRQGLDHASGYFRHAIARRLRMKVAPAVTFEVDDVFEQAAKVEDLLREIAPPLPVAAANDAAEDDAAEDDAAEDDAAEDDSEAPDGDEAESREATPPSGGTEEK
jgi:ribosome-binding factor A